MIQSTLGVMLVAPLLAVITIPTDGPEGLLLRVGAASLAAGGIWGVWGRPIQRWFIERDHRHEERLKRIEEQVTTNGSRNLLPPDQRDLPLADLVVMHIVGTAPLITQYQKDLRDRFEDADLRIRSEGVHEGPQP